MNKESNSNFGDLLDQQMQNFHRDFSPGEKITGKVTAIEGNDVFVDIGGRSEGILDLQEILDQDGNSAIEEDQEIEVYFLSDRGGEIRLTTRISGGDADESSILDARDSQIPIEGKVTGEVNGGYEVEIGNKRGFCPYSQIDLHRQDPAAYIGQKFNFMITECDDSLRNLVLSRREILTREREKMKEELKQKLEPGSTVEGTVSRIVNFGVFVDLGAGIDGLIHVSELGWGRNINAEDIVAPGDRVSVMVKDLDWDNGRISLSLRYAEANPWENAEQKYPTGCRTNGTVTKLMPFGAFVELEPGIEGLLHISKIGGGRRINHPQEVLQENSEIEVIVETVDIENQRISLGLDQPSGSEDKAESVDEETLKAHLKSGDKKENQSFGNIGDLLDEV